MLDINKLLLPLPIPPMVIYLCFRFILIPKYSLFIYFFPKDIDWNICIFVSTALHGEIFFSKRMKQIIGLFGPVQVLIILLITVTLSGFFRDNYLQKVDFHLLRFRGCTN